MAAEIPVTSPHTGSCPTSKPRAVLQATVVPMGSASPVGMVPPKPVMCLEQIP